MFEVKDDLTIYATRGDVVMLTISADDNGVNYRFMPGEVIRMKVFEKKDCQCVVMQKDFVVEEEGEYIDITLTEKDTRIGELISKPKAYWYEVELNPDTATQTIIGYDDNGAKVFMLMPEGKELAEYPPADVPTAIEVQEQLERVEKEIVPKAENAAAAAKQAAANANTAAEAAQSYTVNPPKPLNGKWHLWNGTEYAESNEPSQGETGIAGKSAYQYAQENGYNGTEEEYANDVNPDRVSSAINAHGKRLDNLEAALYPDIVTPVADDTMAYTKDVPLNALPNAEVAAVGGMTHREDDTLRSAPVTSIESVGANLIPFPYYAGGVGTVYEMNGLTFTVNADGSITVNGTATGFTSFVLWDTKDTNDFYVTKGFLSGIPNGYEKTFALRLRRDSTVDIGRDYGSGLYFETSAKNIQLAIAIQANTTIDNETIYPMLNEGSTALPYAPYIKTTLPIPEAVQALDGYGDGVDTASNYIDFEKKQYIQTVGKVDMGEQAWAASGQLKYCNISTLRPPATFEDRCTGFVCAKYPASSNGDTSNMDNKSMIRRNSAIYVRDDDIDVASFKAAMSGVMLYYELAEPVITDISHLLSDDNYIPVEGGGIITMQNEHGYAVPSTIEYTVKGASAE